MKIVQNHIVALITALMILSASFASALHLSQVSFETHIGAAWTFAAIFLTVIGVLVSPLVVLGALMGIINEILQPTLKNKRKRMD
jgi:hypothetical protein